MEEIVRFLGAGRYREALELLSGSGDKAIPETTPYPLFLKGLVSFRLGQIAEARAFFADFANQVPDHFYNLVYLARCLNKQGDRTGARETLRAALKINPQSAEAWSQLAAWARGAGDEKEARDAFRRALLLRPDSRHTRALIGAAKDFSRNSPVNSWDWPPDWPQSEKQSPHPAGKLTGDQTKIGINQSGDISSTSARLDTEPGQKMDSVTPAGSRWKTLLMILFISGLYAAMLAFLIITDKT